MRMQSLIIVLVLILGASFSEAGRYYRFVDENGVVVFTDDLSQIPPHLRGAVQVSPGVADPPGKVSGSENAAEDQDASGNRDGALSKEAEAAAALNAEKDELDKEYEAIAAEGRRLNELNGTLTDGDSVARYNEQVDRLNRRTRDYQQKQAEYVRKARDFNAAREAQ